MPRVIQSRRPRVRDRASRSQILAVQIVSPIVLPRMIQSSRRVRRAPKSRSQILFKGKRTFSSEARGLYRVFSTAEYRFYRSSTGPPAVTDTPFDTNATLPHNPTDTYVDGTWYVSVSYFNGIFDSGFLPLGSNGETYVRIDIASGAVVLSPPAGPTVWHLEHVGSGVVRVWASYLESGTLRATEWSLAFTVNGSDPGADAPDVVQAIDDSGGELWGYDLPAQGHGTTVKARLQMRRLDSSYQYSESSIIKTLVVDTSGPAAVQGGG